ncbi:MAG: ATP-binding protein [Polyangiaceae bacterium]|nr:ATP-binding protein [Polyangiaceae bacterium]
MFYFSHMLHARVAQKRLLALARQFPAVVVVGPRQIGKSSLAQLAFPGYTHLDLENPLDLARVQAEPLLLLEENPRLVLDEAQRLPEVFPILRSHLDRKPRARVVLLGSAAPGLVRNISESLAGRAGFFELGGLSYAEQDLRMLWEKGGFPRVHWSRPRASPSNWYPAYVQACLERDIPQLGFFTSSLRFRNLLTMVAHAQGSVSHLSEFAGSLGLSYHSVSHLLDVLEGVFLIRRLPPYYANVRKRLVKSPKLYIRDTGLLHSLLGITHTRRALLAHPKAGASFETFCIEQLIMHARLTDPSMEAFFYRTHVGHEVDLLLRLRGRLVPIEIKLGLGVPDVRGLETCMQDLGINKGYVVNAGTEPVQIRRNVVMGGLAGTCRALGIAPGMPAGRASARRS